MELFEHTCRVMSLDDLILAKEAPGLEKSSPGGQRTSGDPRETKI